MTSPPDTANLNSARSLELFQDGPGLPRLVIAAVIFLREKSRASRRGENGERRRAVEYRFQDVVSGDPWQGGDRLEAVVQEHFVHVEERKARFPTTSKESRFRRGSHAEFGPWRIGFRSLRRKWSKPSGFRIQKPSRSIRSPYHVAP